MEFGEQRKDMTKNASPIDLLSLKSLYKEPNIIQSTIKEEFVKFLVVVEHVGLTKDVMVILSSVNVDSSIHICKHYSDYKQIKQITTKIKKQDKTRNPFKNLD